jgi:uncharacterized protein (TIGR02118 family)
LPGHQLWKAQRHMVKLVILFRQPEDEATFEPGYNDSLALLERLPGIRRRQACTILGSPSGRSPYYRILELYFDDFEALDLALRSAEGQAAGGALMRFAGHSAELLFADVYED